MTRLVVFSYKECWPSAASPSGYATDGGFPLQMRAISELFDQTILVLPCHPSVKAQGESAIGGNNLSVAPLTPLTGSGLRRKVKFGLWLVQNSPVLIKAALRADAVHAPIPGDIGTIGMLLAFVLRKPLFVRHCGNWFKPVTNAEHFWKWFMERFAGGRNVMLATGGGTRSPSQLNGHVRWIFATTLTAHELESLSISRELPTDRLRLVIACRQDREKGTGTVIESLPKILKDFPWATLDVLGDGKDLPEFKRLASDLGVDRCVRFHGRLNHHDLIALLEQGDLFCYPTRASEGFPKVVLEAMACGLPVVTTRVSVLPDLIGERCGILLDEPTAEAVARAVKTILANKESYARMSAQAIQVASQFSLERWGETIRARLQAQWGDLLAMKREMTQTNA